MARNKKVKLKSDLKLTIDISGRYRIGGKFASKRSVAAWKSARTKRGISSRPHRDNRISEEDARQRRIEQSRRAAVSRKDKRKPDAHITSTSRFELVRDYLSEKGFRKRIWEVADPDLFDIDASLFREIIDVEKRNFPNEPLIFHAWIEGTDTYDDLVSVGSFAQTDDNPNAAEEIASEIQQWFNQYQFASLDTLALDVSLVRRVRT